jgi:hypothetical protein
MSILYLKKQQQRGFGLSFGYCGLKMTQIIYLSKEPLGSTANLFTAQFFCESLYRRVLSPFKFVQK